MYYCLVDIFFAFCNNLCQNPATVVVITTTTSSSSVLLVINAPLDSYLYFLDNPLLCRNKSLKLSLVCRVETVSPATSRSLNSLLLWTISVVFGNLFMLQLKLHFYYQRQSGTKFQIIPICSLTTRCDLVLHTWPLTTSEFSVGQNKTEYA